MERDSRTVNVGRPHVGSSDTNKCDERVTKGESVGHRESETSLKTRYNDHDHDGDNGDNGEIAAESKEAPISGKKNTLPCLRWTEITLRSEFVSDSVLETTKSR